ncbi:MAG TPA: AAA family ATPase [Gemmatimonadaceae bacterium]|nr:AAA family ATPase [Gemmatimonadaceae bacterium]
MILGESFGADGALSRFTRDLTADARAGLLEPVRCREPEIDRVVAILLRHGKNNPTLVGPAGVGTTAIAEGLAQRIARGGVPLALREVRLLSLDHVGLLAGTTFRGQYEERIRALVDEASRADDVVLFIDELHNLIGQGTAMGVAMDAANMLKPALVRGDFRVIGATTDEEYERWICADPALERRFQKVAVRELGAEETLEILRARQERLERHHNVVITDDAVVAAVRLTDQFVADRARPDRAIDALDEACAHRQATTTHSARAEALIRERRRLLHPRSDGAGPPEGPAAAGTAVGEEDPIENFAREGFAVLERLGAELEAAFTGAPARPTAGGTAPETPRRAPAAATHVPGARRPLADVDAELRRVLSEEGTVVRPPDVARVVGLMTGKTIVWTD